MTNEKDQKIIPVHRDPIPNKAFDSEYMTERGREADYPADQRIRYTVMPCLLVLARSDCCIPVNSASAAGCHP